MFKHDTCACGNILLFNKAHKNDIIPQIVVSYKKSNLLLFEVTNILATCRKLVPVSHKILDGDMFLEHLHESWSSQLFGEGSTYTVNVYVMQCSYNSREHHFLS